MCESEAEKREKEVLRTLENNQMSSTFVCFFGNNRTLNEKVSDWVIQMMDNRDVARNCWTNPKGKEQDSEDRAQFVRRMRTRKAGKDSNRIKKQSSSSQYKFMTASESNVSQAAHRTYKRKSTNNLKVKNSTQKIIQSTKVQGLQSR